MQEGECPEGTEMIDITAWAATGAGLLGAALATLNGRGLFRIYLRHRAQVQRERARSDRCAARVAGIADMLGHPQVRVRMVERDMDGERLIEIAGTADSPEIAA